MDADMQKAWEPWNLYVSFYVYIPSDYEVVNPSYEKSDLTLGRKDQNCILSNLPFNLEGYWVLPR